MIDRMPHQIEHLNRLVGVMNVDRVFTLRMDHNTFKRLVLLLHQLGGV